MAIENAIAQWLDRDYYRGEYRVTLEWIGEGYDGDYNPDDPKDKPLIRFSCYRRDDSELGWADIEDASYCTNLSIDTNPSYLDRAAELLLDGVTSSCPKRRMQELSWLSAEDFKNKGEIAI